MPNSFRIARIAGIDVYLHFTFLLFLAYFGFYGWQRFGEAGMVFSLLAFVFLFLCVLLHEFGHAFAARMYGIATPDITLLPIGGVARIERMPENPREEIVIALAGPLVNVVIATVLGLGLVLSGGLNPQLFALVLNWQIHEFPDIPTAIMHLLFLNNIVLVLFNMLPAFPMDGGRVLRASLAMFYPLDRATYMAAGVGKVIAILFCAIGLMSFYMGFTGGHPDRLWNPMLLILGIFIYFAASREAESMLCQTKMQGLDIRDVMITNFKGLPQHATLREAIQARLSSYQLDFPVLDPDGGLLGMVSKREMNEYIRKNHNLEVEVLRIMRKEVPTVTLTSRMREVLDKMNQTEAGALGVLDQFGRVIGLVTPENIEETISIREALRPTASSG